MTKDEALKLALEALKSIAWHDDGWGLNPDLIEAAMPAIKEALAQPAQEPIAWVDLQKEAQQIVESKFLWKRFIDGTPLSNDIACWMANFAQQHTAPQQRPWVGLTDDEINTTWKKWIGTERANKSYTLAIEAKLKDKNNAA